MLWGVRLLELFAKKEKIQLGAKFCENLSYFATVYDDYVNLHNPKVEFGLTRFVVGKRSGLL